MALMGACTSNAASAHTSAASATSAAGAAGAATLTDAPTKAPKEAPKDDDASHATDESAKPATAADAANANANDDAQPPTKPDQPPPRTDAQVWIVLDAFAATHGLSPRDSFHKLYEVVKDPTNANANNNSSGLPGVWRRVTHRETKQLRSAFIVDKKKDLGGSAKFRETAFKDLRTYIEILRISQHPNVQHAYEVFETNEHLHIVTDKIAGQELFDRILDQPDGAFGEADARHILRQLFAAVAHLHTHQVVHCDVKPENVMIVAEAGTATPMIRLKGFESAISIAPSARTERKTRGTPYYIAPEVISVAACKPPCDAWSLGVVMFVMLFGIPPFNGNTDADVLKEVKIGFAPSRHFPADSKVSAAARDLISHLLLTDVKVRFTVADALKHEWFVGATKGVQGETADAEESTAAEAGSGA